MRTAILIIVFTLMTIRPVNSNDQTYLTNINDLKSKLEEIIKCRLTDNAINPIIALDAIVDFYNQHKTLVLDDFNDSDMLLFQYGIYNWDGLGEKFELDFTRQIVDPTDDEFFQIRLTLYYKLEDIGAINAFNLWSINRPTLDDWIKTIKETEGFIRATKRTSYEFKIELTKT